MTDGIRETKLLYMCQVPFHNRQYILYILLIINCLECTVYEIKVGIKDTIKGITKTNQKETKRPYFDSDINIVIFVIVLKQNHTNQIKY